MPTKSILLVTHNIEEAVLLCDRILLFSSNPGRVATEIRVELGHPRDRLDPAFRRLVDDIYSRMTAKGVAPGREPARGPHGTHGVGIDMALPRVSSNVLAGLLESVAAAPYDGKADLPAVAAALQLEVDDLFHIAETLQLLRFADLEAGDIILTAAGRHFVESAVDARKRLFAEHLLAYVPLAAHIKRVLDERPQHRAPQSRFVQELEDHMTDGRAEQTMRAIVSWGRYAEIFAYDEQAAEFSLENPT